MSDVRKDRSYRDLQEIIKILSNVANHTGDRWGGSANPTWPVATVASLQTGYFCTLGLTLLHHGGARSNTSMRDYQPMEVPTLCDMMRAATSTSVNG